MLSCLSPTSHPLIALNLPRRLVAMADALSGKDNIDLLLLLSYDVSPISGPKRKHLKPNDSQFCFAHHWILSHNCKLMWTNEKERWQAQKNLCAGCPAAHLPLMLLVRKRTMYTLAVR
jgi:hypothetical protein